MVRGIPLEKKIGFFQPLFRAWAERGYGSGTAYRKYMEEREKIPKEYRLRKTDFLRAYREWAGLPKKRESWKYTRRDRKPTEKAIVKTLRNPMRNYVFSTNVTYYDRDTGVSETIPYNISSDTLLTKKEVEERIKSIVGWEYPNIVITHIEHRAIFGRKE